MPSREFWTAGRDSLDHARSASGGAAATVVECEPTLDLDRTDWPAQVDLILSALETGQHGKPSAGSERRNLRRRHYRVRAALRLFSDGSDTPAHPVFTRDVHARGLGFITPHRLPLGHGGLIELPRPSDGELLRVHCTLLRCREAAPGWFEGSVYFNREQADFAE